MGLTELGHPPHADRTHRRAGGPAQRPSAGERGLNEIAGINKCLTDEPGALWMLQVEYLVEPGAPVWLTAEATSGPSEG